MIGAGRVTGITEKIGFCFLRSVVAAVAEWAGAATGAATTDAATLAAAGNAVL